MPNIWIWRGALSFSTIHQGTLRGMNHADELFADCAGRRICLKNQSPRWPIPAPLFGGLGRR